MFYVYYILYKMMPILYLSIPKTLKYWSKPHVRFDVLMQDRSNSIANALELLQSWTKPAVLQFWTRPAVCFHI